MYTFCLMCGQILATSRRSHHKWRDSPRFADRRPHVAAASLLERLRERSVQVQLGWKTSEWLGLWGYMWGLYGITGNFDKQLYGSMPYPQLTCTLPDRELEDGFPSNMANPQGLCLFQGRYCNSFQHTNKGIEPQKLVWTHTECQQEFKPWNIFERFEFCHNKGD